MTVDADLDRIADIRALVREVALSSNAPPACLDDLVQAVDEATCNVMLHGYKSQPGDIDIEASVRDRKIEIKILDRAPAFDPRTAPTRDATTPPVPTRIGGMGLGIELLRTLTDEVHHSARPDGGNELTLVRSIDSPTQEE